MHTAVEFRSNKFPSYGTEVEGPNENIWGKRLAHYLISKLKEKGYKIRTTYTEDWGWGVELEHEPFRLWLGCSNLDEEPDGHRVFIEPSKPVVRVGLFKKVETTADVQKLAEDLKAILEADPDIRDLVWGEL